MNNKKKRWLKEGRKMLHKDKPALPLACLRRKAGFGLNEVIGIAAGIIIAVVVVIPGLQGFAGDILKNLTNWWNNMASSVFTTP